MIDAYLKSEVESDDAAMHLLFSANRWEKRKQLKETLESGTTIVADRYAFSGVAFSAGKGLPHLTPEWCRAPDQGLPAPDAVFFMQLSPEAAATRGGYGQERYEDPLLQASVKRQFESLRDASWHVVDAARDIPSIQADVQRLADDALRRADGGEGLQELWRA
ncbi:hypothetical protein H632_c1047p0 [Helicosporidium sp. ATCC 50920]|nr:hypothetical protein H632_c1047p0 [Helicosporidium sp. ATCC 50920]|eukprot:KDD74830.1 hypothetical protein H632_c1047p0 [Helicosporidium sp. ATCC 50920]